MWDEDLHKAEEDKEKLRMEELAKAAKAIGLEHELGGLYLYLRNGV